ncbi:MAG: sigma-54-dependent Fis family transcriptional regulator [Deltaproteobacteria bacterium]|nr:sigma-54-dependent Fis family transcriptional regulator [Deltaproteobacteria bacterium]
MQEESILVIDDEESMRLALSETLSRSGHQVDCVSNGYDALKKVQSSSLKLIITDVRMPKMDGMEVLKEIKKLLPQIPVIMITAYGTIHNAVEAMKKGAVDYILKPFSFEELNAVVERALVGGKKQEAEVKDNQKYREIVTRDPEMLRLINLVKSVALSTSTILIQGESGTGKEMFARYIHQHSERREKSFVAVNCAAIPENLLESELFGYEKGAFTGAISKRAGKFELADGGTILLDEVSEMDSQLQAKLLRVLQEFEIDRVGGREPVPIDVRVVATTNVDLKQAIEEGEFREDLFYRLNVIPLKIPPLRERREDIHLLVDHFVKKHSLKCQKEVPQVSPEVLSILKNFEWRGNVRELENVIERTILLHKDDVLLPEHLIVEEADRSREEKEGSSTSSGSVKEMEKKLILKTLEGLEGNRTHAAKALGISIRTLRNKLKEYKGREGIRAW